MKDELEKLRNENQYLKQLLVKMMNRESSYEDSKIVSKKSSLEEKVSLFTSLFKGRTDIYASRWESQSGGNGYSPTCGLEWQKPICQKPIIKCNQCQHRRLLSLTDQVLVDHIEGKKQLVYIHYYWMELVTSWQLILTKINGNKMFWHS